MERRRLAGHSPYEPVVGYSRAVVVGPFVHVAGTAPTPIEGDPPEGAYEQARLCIELIAEALERAGSRLEDVVRTRILITDLADWEDIARAHGEAFAETRPAATAMVVKGLLDPRWRVEIEADAVLSAVDDA